MSSAKSGKALLVLCTFSVNYFLRIHVIVMLRFKNRIPRHPRD